MKYARVVVLQALMYAMVTSASVHGYRHVSKHPDIHIVDVGTQSRRMEMERQKCAFSHKKRPNNGSFCPDVFDGIYCWMDVRVGETAVIPCPNYFNGFYVDAVASRTCELDGRWFVNPRNNQTYSNYTQCIFTRRTNTLYTDHVPRIMLMSTIGYGMSFVSLVTGSFILVYFKRLHCPRNTMHLNLFLSFILRAAVSCTKDTLLVDGLGLREDLIEQPGGWFVFNPNVPHWRCKLLFAVFQYSLAVNYMWVFMEGLYLHNMIFLSIVTERTSVTKYVVVGWTVPFLLVIPWALVRLLVDNVLCWNTNPTPAFSWIIKGPTVVILTVNFLFFLNILRVLFSKTRVTTSPKTKHARNRKLASATLVLIPLFGVQYMVFIGLPDDSSILGVPEIVKLYSEMFFSSFQGFIVAALYCFLSGEVKNELRRKYRRYKLRRKTKTRASLSPSSTSVHSCSPRRRHSYHSCYSSSSERGRDSSQSRFQTPERYHERRYHDFYLGKPVHDNGFIGQGGMRH